MLPVFILGMAILKNKRKLSKYEYEHSFDVAYKHLGICMKSVPNRMKYWINKPINQKLNFIYSNIMELRTNYFNDSEKDALSLSIINSVIDEILSLQICFYSFWNIMNYDDQKKIYWCELFNKVLLLLYGLRKKNILYNLNYFQEERFIMYYKNDDLKKVKFLNNMSELHKYTHKRIAHAKKLYADRECDMLSDFVNMALYSCLEANKKIPTNKHELEIRSKYFSNAISNLKKMEIPMLSLFNLMDYSENILKEWSELFTYTLNSLYAIKKSDKNRFKNLI